jgi:hypothetical protein
MEAAAAPIQVVDLPKYDRRCFLAHPFLKQGLSRQEDYRSMIASPAFREKMYRTYLEFFENAERKRRWHIFDDIPWESLDASKNDERKAVCVETFCAEEFYLPDSAPRGSI